MGSPLSSNAPMGRVPIQVSRERIFLLALALLPLLRIIFPISTIFSKSPFEADEIPIAFDNSSVRFLAEPRFTEPYEILVAVVSASAETHIRDAIRRSWAHPAFRDRRETAVVFLVGVPEDREVHEATMKEAKEKNDLIIVNVTEDYYHLSEKTYALMYFKATKYPHIRCLVKADSDNVLNLPNYERFCEETKAPLIAGHCKVSRRVIRFGSKWAVPRRVYAEDEWPQYCSAGTYVVLGKNVPQQLLSAADSSPFNYSPNFRRLPEDVLFTGIFADEANINRKHIGAISFRDLPEFNCRGSVKYTYSLHMNRYLNPEYYHKRLISREGASCLF